MEYKQIKGNEIEGHLDIFIHHNFVGVIVGRLDGKGTKHFYNRYIQSDKNKVV